MNSLTHPLKIFFGPMRIPFLLLTPCCVLVGVATAARQSGTINPIHLALVLIGALAAHASVNAFNEYFDFLSGLDVRTVRTPFSGGSGTLPGHPQSVKTVLATAVLAVFITVSIGVFFLIVRGSKIFFVGIPGILTVLLYTPRAVKHPLPCLIMPGFGFGTCMVNGTHFALTGSYSWAAFAASFVPFFLVNNLLLLNQFPDAEADRSVGRRNYPIVVGRKTSSRIYTALLILAYTTTLLGVVFGLFPKTSMLGFLTVPLAILAIRGVMRYRENIPALIPFMVINVALNLATPVLFAVGIWMG
jgi:1,4-dihydroxy-2-naphthoate octaprenyltransferase